MHCTWRNVRIPPDPVRPPFTTALHHSATTNASCCSPPFHHHALSLRSPGQTGHEESPAESYSQHTLFPCCRCAPRFCIVYIYIRSNTHMHARIIYVSKYSVSSCSVPRVSATSAPRFPLLRYWHIASLSSSDFYRCLNTVVHRRPPLPPINVLGNYASRARACNQCLQPGVLGHLLTRKCNYYYE